MAPAHLLHPSIRRTAPFLAVAFIAVAATTLLLVDGAVAVPAAVAQAAPDRRSGDPVVQTMGISEQFQQQKAMALVHELPAQF
jgi:hypothetical protein